jgi:serine/threonine protein kinase
VSKYIQINHLYEVKRIIKIFPNCSGMTLIKNKDSMSGNSVYEIELESELKTTKFIKIGYTMDMKCVVDAFNYFGDVHVKCYDKNILVTDVAKGYRLTDILLDYVPDRILQFKEFELIGIAIGSYIRNLYLSKVFQGDINKDPVYLKVCERCKNSTNINNFIEAPGDLRLIHGDLNPNNIFVEFDKDVMLTDDTLIKITLIDLDKFALKLKTGGLAPYEYHQFISSIDWASHKHVNNYNLKYGFIRGYNITTDIAPNYSYQICGEYWDKNNKQINNTI